MAQNQAPVVDRIRIIPRPDDFLDRQVGSSGEVFFDKEANTLRVYSGKLQGGYELLTTQNLAQKSTVATVVYDVIVQNTGEGNKYILSGQYKPPLNFTKGYTYIFDQSDPTNVWYPNVIGSTNNQHPLYFSDDDPNGAIGSAATVVNKRVSVGYNGTRNIYYINGLEQPVLTVKRGNTYVFDQSGPTNEYYGGSVHAFMINTDELGNHYTTGVVFKLDGATVSMADYVTNFASADERIIEWTVDATAPNRLYYDCMAHPGMGNRINVQDTGTHYSDGVQYILDDIPVSLSAFEQGFENATKRQTLINVTNDTPSVLYYWCQNHLNMGNTISVSLPGAGSGGVVDSGASVDVGDNPPGTPEEGNIWFNSANGRLYVYIEDDDSAQWVQPVAPVPSVNTFSSIEITGDPATTLTADSSDQTLFFEAGSNVTLSINDTTKTVTINSTGGIAPGSDVTLGDVTADSISTTSFINTGLGSPVFDSATTLTLSSTDGVVVSGGGTFRLPSFTTLERDALGATNGDLVYNSTDNRIQAYQNGAWINLDDGTAA